MKFVKKMREFKKWSKERELQKVFGGLGECAEEGNVTK